MAIRNIRTEEDPILRKTSKTIKEVTERTDELIDDMIESLKEFNGVGLAAVQVGVLKRLCIIHISPEDAGDDEEEDTDVQNGACLPGYMSHTDDEDLVIINPEIEVIGNETQTGNEGCLSIPNKWGVVTRPMNIILKAFDRNMQPYELKACGLLARAICHETDHMYGKLYIDIVEGDLMTNAADGEE